MPKVFINGKEFEVAAGTTVLQAALANGIYIPHFCYHPHLPISGCCRMCLVEIEGMPKQQISCATTVADNMKVQTESPAVQKSRQIVMEFTLKNHPIDCPICDKAGECTLQDFYMRFDGQPSRLFADDAKVHKGKALVMGPTLVLDQERCILCDRCVRFMREVAKDECLTLAQRHDRVAITTFPGREVNNPYSLCLTDVCPVGAWTARDFRFRKRVWFLKPMPSICPSCARGCNIFIDQADFQVYRIWPRRNDQINRSWACDQGRMAYHALNDRRLTQPLVKKGGVLAPASWEEAIAAAAKILQPGAGKLGTIISASATNEEGAALTKLASALGAAAPALLFGQPGFEDEILMRADLNANRAGLEKLGIKGDPVAAVAQSNAVLVLEALPVHDLDLFGKAGVVLSPTHTKAVEQAQVALPAAAFSESSGTFVNFQGIEQPFQPAMAPRGQAKPALAILKDLAQKLGKRME